jgi:hypothetical protein
MSDTLGTRHYLRKLTGLCHYDNRIDGSSPRARTRRELAGAKSGRGEWLMREPPASMAEGRGGRGVGKRKFVFRLFNHDSSSFMWVLASGIISRRVPFHTGEQSRRRLFTGGKKRTLPGPCRTRYNRYNQIHSTQIIMLENTHHGRQVVVRYRQTRLGQDAKTIR